MPEISRFFGIVISMNYNDHEPPHFHVRYGEQRAIIGIAPLALLRGDPAPRALAMVMEWAAKHLDTLRDDWALARAQQALLPIAPLE